MCLVSVPCTLSEVRGRDVVMLWVWTSWRPTAFVFPNDIVKKYVMDLFHITYTSSLGRVRVPSRVSELWPAFIWVGRLAIDIFISRRSPELTCGSHISSVYRIVPFGVTELTSNFSSVRLRLLMCGWVCGVPVSMPCGRHAEISLYCVSRCCIDLPSQTLVRLQEQWLQCGMSC